MARSNLTVSKSCYVYLITCVFFGLSVYCLLVCLYADMFSYLSVCVLPVYL
jgi:hypothetical protein